MTPREIIEDTRKGAAVVLERLHLDFVRVREQAEGWQIQQAGKRHGKGAC